MSAQAQVRDRAGRFDGLRVDLEAVPAIPSTAAAILLRDPNRRPVVLVWADPAGSSSALYIVTVEPVPGRADTLEVTPLGIQRTMVRVRPVPRRARGALTEWRCPRCTRQVRWLFPWGLAAGEPGFALGCRQCLALSYGSRGGARTWRHIVRHLARIPHDQPLPRRLLVPSTMAVVGDRRLRRYANLRISQAPVGADWGATS